MSSSVRDVLFECIATNMANERPKCQWLHSLKEAMKSKEVSQIIDKSKEQAGSLAAEEAPKRQVYVAAMIAAEVVPEILSEKHFSLASGLSTEGAVALMVKNARTILDRIVKEIRRQDCACPSPKRVLSDRQKKFWNLS